MVAGLLIGLGSGAILHLALGSPAGRLTLDQIAIALERARRRRRPTSVTRRSNRPASRWSRPTRRRSRNSWSRSTAGTHGTASSSPRSGRSLWRRGERPSLGFGRLQTGGARGVRHLVRRARGRAGPPDRRCRHGEPTRRAVGQRDHGTASRFPRRARGQDDRGQGIWRAAPKLHELGIAHGQLDGDRIVIRADGTPRDRRLRRRPRRRHRRRDDGRPARRSWSRPRSSSVPNERWRRRPPCSGTTSFAEHPAVPAAGGPGP